jgi:hypothetical protein
MNEPTADAALAISRACLLLVKALFLAVAAQPAIDARKLMDDYQALVAEHTDQAEDQGVASALQTFLSQALRPLDRG